MERLKRIDASIKEGYAFIMERNDWKNGCDKWLEAWEGIKELFTEGVAEDIFELNGKYKWTHPISNYAQDLEMELHNAGVDDKAYHQKRAAYCKELIQWCKDELTVNNTRIGMAEAYFELGDYAAGDQIFSEWLRDDPGSGMGHSGWANCYRGTFDSSHYGKAEEILLAAYARDMLRDRHYVVEGLINLYNDMGKPDKAKEYADIYAKLRPARVVDAVAASKASPVKVVKIGRNEPCPCGSGKKYKKCCGA